VHEYARSSSFNTGRIDHLYNNPEIHGKRTVSALWRRNGTRAFESLLEKIEPDEIIIWLHKAT